MRTAFMKQRSDELRHGPNWFQLSSIQNMAAQVNFFCFLMFFFCLACSVVPENWHICVNKGITYL